MSCTQCSMKPVFPGASWQMMVNGDSVFWKPHLCRLEHSYDISSPPYSSSVAPKNLSYCGPIFVSISVMTYTTTYSVLDIRTHKTQRSSIMAFGLSSRSWSKCSENASKTFLTCHFWPTPGMTKLKIHSLVNSSTITVTMNMHWPRRESYSLTLSNIMHTIRLSHLLNCRLVTLFSWMDKAEQGRHSFTIQSAMRSVIMDGLCCVWHLLALQHFSFMVAIQPTWCLRFQYCFTRSLPVQFLRKEDSHH